MTAALVTLQADDLVVCPHCGKANQDPVADWVIPLEVDEPSRCRSECEHCDGDIDVEYNGFGYLVSAP